MECEGFEAEVVALLYGELSPEQRALAEAHAASCESCGKLSRELGEARQAASLLPKRESPPRELDERIALAARFAADSRDVRAQPLRGGALHVAAASVLLGIITVSAFGLGTWVNRPHRLNDPPEEPWERQPIARNTPRVQSTPDPREIHATPSPESDEHLSDRDSADRQKKYNDDLLKLARDELQSGEPLKALTMLDALIGKAKSNRLPWVLEARLERARAFYALARFDEARQEARGVREVIAADYNGDVMLRPTDEGAMKVIEDANQKIPR